MKLFLFRNQVIQKRDKRLNISCPENSDFIKTETNNQIYTIKEDDEYKFRGYIHKLKIPILKLTKDIQENNPNSRNKNYNMQISERSNNNSINKTKENTISSTVKNKEILTTSKNSPYLLKAENYSKYINNRQITSKIHTYKNSEEKNDNNKNFSITPPKYSNYSNYKVNSLNKKYPNKINNINNSLNRSIDINQKINNYNLNTSTNKNATRNNIPNTRNYENLNISEKMSFGNSKKKTSDKTNLIKKSIITDTALPKIPIDKNSYNKIKNININFYQNIIINKDNNVNKKSKNNSNNNSVVKDDKKNNDEKCKISSIERDNSNDECNNPSNSKNYKIIQNGDDDYLSPNKNLFILNIDNKITNLNDSNMHNKHSAITRRSSSMTGSLNSDNMSKTTITSICSGGNFSNFQIFKI